MARERRVLRLQQLIQEIVAEALLREVEDPRLEMVTVTRVRLTADLALGEVVLGPQVEEPGGALGPGSDHDHREEGGGLGQAAPNPILSVIKHFPHELDNDETR